ncbi:Eco57I restriction-modification methylase domain-containing protein [Hydrogenophilus thermoluteolus]|uniref:Eco57I restriction-modification methylase domain-containing protein n=1 Tax=Hydrogenophilus thermoluteolus TaxID=297 RepID=UPI003F67581D
MSKQALLGQFFTPPNVARLIASLVTPRGPVLEPAAGDGAILRALRERFGATPLAIVAVERDPAVALPGTHLANFFAWEPEATFATIVGNPPYVRGQWIDKTTRKLWRSLSDQFALPKLDARANLYLYFIAEGVRRLRPGAN